MLVQNIILLANLAAVYSLPHWHQGKIIHDGHKPGDGKRPHAPHVHVEDQYERFLDQDLDHFNRQLGTTFKQRYFVNTTFWKGDANAPVFLCVGGEGPPLDRTVLSSSVHCNDMVELAPKFNALMLALEHRYYGPSNPFGTDYSTENLKWLNSEQALGDIAHFHSYISTEYSLTSANRWVTWGGSYPGMMAALARLRYPHLIYASVSSSSPLQPTVDFPGYNNVVAHSMAATSVGGSDACLNAIVEGHKVVGVKLQTFTGRRELEADFKICKPLTLEDANNREQFAGDGVVYLPVQSNDPSCTTDYCDIGSICTLMADETKGTSYERLVALADAMHPLCVPISYDDMVEAMVNSTNPERIWIYQTCTEWGFYQTCNTGSDCPYTQGLHTIDVDIAICNAAFNVTKAQLYDQIDFTYAMYGGNQIQGSRILYTSGEIDPWNAGSVLSSPSGSEEEPTLWVVGASHHFWTHPSLPTDSAEVNAARVTIWNQVTAWLQEA